MKLIPSWGREWYQLPLIKSLVVFSALEIFKLFGGYSASAQTDQNSMQQEEPNVLAIKEKIPTPSWEKPVLYQHIQDTGEQDSMSIKLDNTIHFDTATHQVVIDTLLWTSPEGIIWLYNKAWDVEDYPGRYTHCLETQKQLFKQCIDFAQAVWYLTSNEERNESMFGRLSKPKQLKIIIAKAMYNYAKIAREDAQFGEALLYASKYDMLDKNDPTLEQMHYTLYWQYANVLMEMEYYESAIDIYEELIAYKQTPLGEKNGNIAYASIINNRASCQFNLAERLAQGNREKSDQIDTLQQELISESNWNYVCALVVKLWLEKSVDENIDRGLITDRDKKKILHSLLPDLSYDQLIARYEFSKNNKEDGTDWHSVAVTLLSIIRHSVSSSSMWWDNDIQWLINDWRSSGLDRWLEEIFLENDDYEALTELYRIQAIYIMDEWDNQQTLDLLLEAKKLWEQYGLEDELVVIYELLGDYYQQSNDDKKAADYFKLVIEIKDILQVRHTLYEKAYADEQKRKEEKVKNDLELEKAESRNRAMIVMLIAIWAGLVVVVVGYFYQQRTQRKYKKYNDMLKEQHQEILAKNKEIKSQNDRLQVMVEELQELQKKLEDANELLNQKAEKQKATLEDTQQILGEVEDRRKHVYSALIDLAYNLDHQVFWWSFKSMKWLMMILQMSESEDEKEQYITMIEKLIMQVDKKLASVKQLAKVYTERELQPEWINITNFSEDVVGTLDGYPNTVAMKYNIKVSKVYIDKEYFTIALTELLRNAIESIITEEWVEITISSWLQDDTTYIDITDNGQWVVEKEKIFEKYRRWWEDNKQGSIWLWLYTTSYALGKCWVSIELLETNKNQWSTFRIKIPQQKNHPIPDDHI